MGLRSTYRKCRFWQKKKSSFRDEAHFDLGRYVNKQNCRFWGIENPHAYIEKPTDPKRFTVWCGFCSRGIIGAIFSSKMSKERPLQSMAIVIGRGGYWQNLVSTGRRYVPPNRCYTRCFAHCFRRSHYQPQSWCRVVTWEQRFDTVGLLFVGWRQR